MNKHDMGEAPAGLGLSAMIRYLFVSYYTRSNKSTHSLHRSNGHCMQRETGVITSGI